MKKLIALLVVALMVASCNKVSQKRLEGSWKVKEIKDTDADSLNVWKDWLQDKVVKVVFYQDGSIKVFYFNADLLNGYSDGAYLLSEEDKKLTIDLADTIFNSRGYPLDVITLHRSSMTLEGRYYLNLLVPSASADSFRIARWNLEQ